MIQVDEGSSEAELLRKAFERDTQTAAIIGVIITTTVVIAAGVALGCFKRITARIRAAALAAEKARIQKISNAQFETLLQKDGVFCLSKLPVRWRKYVVPKQDPKAKECIERAHEAYINLTKISSLSRLAVGCSLVVWGCGD